MDNFEGGFTAYRAITAEEQEMFEKVMEGIEGAAYEPFAVATQVVHGTNLSFFCRGLQVGKPEEDAYDALVLILKPLPTVSEPPCLVKISKAEVKEEAEIG